MLPLLKISTGKCFVYFYKLCSFSIHQDLKSVLQRDGCGKISLALRVYCAGVGQRSVFFRCQQRLVIEIPADIGQAVMPLGKCNLQPSYTGSRICRKLVVELIIPIWIRGKCAGQFVAYIVDVDDDSLCRQILNIKLTE